MLTIRFKPLAVTTYLTLLAPVLIFFLFWLKPFVGIPASLILIAGLVWLLKHDYLHRSDFITVSRKHLFCIIALVLILVVTSGSLGIFRASVDIPWRTAVLSDLITYPWPVVYPETGNGLSYYVTFWLPVAAVGKLIGITGAKVVLWLWLSYFITLSYLLLITLLKLETPKQMWAAAVIMASWSGLVVIGQLVTLLIGDMHTFTIASQRFADTVTVDSDLYFIFRSNLDLLSNPYNQVAIWPVVLLMLDNKNPRCFFFLGLILLAFSPWGILGIAPLMVAIAIPWLITQIKRHRIANIFKELFSPANIAALVTCTPIFYLYFFRCGPDGVPSSAGGIELIDFSSFTPSIFFILIVFYILEFGIYCFLIYPRFKRDSLFWGVIVTLLIVPLIRIGSAGWDFCLNVSLPAFFILMVMVVAYLLKKPGKAEKTDIPALVARPKWRTTALIICLIIGAISPLLTIGNSITYPMRYGVLEYPDMADMRTLAQKNADEDSSLMPGAADREGAFYRYIAR